MRLFPGWVIQQHSTVGTLCCIYSNSLKLIDLVVAHNGTPHLKAHNEAAQVSFHRWNSHRSNGNTNIFNEIPKTRKKAKFFLGAKKLVPFLCNGPPSFDGIMQILHLNCSGPPLMRQRWSLNSLGRPQKETANFITGSGNRAGVQNPS